MKLLGFDRIHVRNYMYVCTYIKHYKITSTLQHDKKPIMFIHYAF